LSGAFFSFPPGQGEGKSKKMLEFPKERQNGKTIKKRERNKTLTVAFSEMTKRSGSQLSVPEYLISFQ